MLRELAAPKRAARGHGQETEGSDRSQGRVQGAFAEGAEAFPSGRGLPGLGTDREGEADHSALPSWKPTIPKRAIRAKVCWTRSVSSTILFMGPSSSRSAGTSNSFAKPGPPLTSMIQAPRSLGR